MLPYFYFKFSLLLATVALAAAEPQPTRWPDSADYTIYSGPSTVGDPVARAKYTQIRHIQRRYHHLQQLEVTAYCHGGTADPDKCCIFDNCAGNDPAKGPWIQIPDCHLLYWNATIWEYYPTKRRCAKMFQGAGMPIPEWFTRSGITIPGGKEVVADVPDAHRNRTCYKYSDHAPGNLTSHYWIFENGTVCKHHFPGGVDEYANFRAVEPNTTEMWELPSYCPPWDSEPKLKAVLPEQEYICTGFWF